MIWFRQKYPSLKLKLPIVAVGIMLSGTACSDTFSSVNKYRTSGGNAQMFPNIDLPTGGGISRLLPFSPALQTAHDFKSANKANTMMDRNASALTGLLIHKRRIVFERYRRPAAAGRRMHSMSMSKSLTALVIGNLLCDGKIKSLEEKAIIYAPQLEGTVQGDTKIRNLLMMASGIETPKQNGSPKPKAYQNLRDQRISSLELLKGLKRVNGEGSEFTYNSADTIALSQVMDTFGGLVRNFYFYIWSRIGPEQKGSWMIDFKGDPIAFAGFNATLRDWGRLGLYVMDMAKGRGGDCMKKFVTDMNSKQIKNNWRRGRPGQSFSHYGYQTWVMQNGSAWWVGYGGQRVGFNFDEEKVIVIHSHVENYMVEAYGVFDFFAK